MVRFFQHDGMLRWHSELLLSVLPRHWVVGQLREHLTAKPVQEGVSSGGTRKIPEAPEASDWRCVLNRAWSLTSDGAAAKRRKTEAGDSGDRFPMPRSKRLSSAGSTNSKLLHVVVSQ